jgi:hypothetical protein
MRHNGVEISEAGGVSMCVAAMGFLAVMLIRLFVSIFTKDGFTEGSPFIVGNNDKWDSKYI